MVGREREIEEIRHKREISRLIGRDRTAKLSRLWICILDTILVNALNNTRKAQMKVLPSFSLASEELVLMKCGETV